MLTLIAAERRKFAKSSSIYIKRERTHAALVTADNLSGEAEHTSLPLT
jgi:hypothetical protein